MMIDWTSLVSTEDGFRDLMVKEVEPYLSEHMTKGTYNGYDGKPIAYRILTVPNAKASVMLVHGFSEFMEKYNEFIYVLLQNNLNVYAIDLRGHGDSVRLTDDPSKVYVGSFKEYVLDLKGFYNSFLKDSALPLCMIGHSMGGAIAILYAEKHPHDFERYIFSSPMVRMNPGKLPFLVVLSISGLVATLGSGLGLDCAYAAGQHPFDPTSRLEQSSCRSPERYEYIMDMRRNSKKNQTWSGTYAWVAAACMSSIRLLSPRKIRRIDRPVLVLGAGHDHLINETYMRKFLASLPNAEYRFFPDSRHEIYHGLKEDRIRFYEEVLGFMR